MKKTAKDLKKILSLHMLYDLGYSVVCDEFEFMDVFGIRRNGYSVEFEIKVSKSDFVQELNAITMAQPAKYSKGWTKWDKHAHYLKKEIKEDKSTYSYYAFHDLPSPPYFIPNEFNFYVPEHLAVFALEKLQGLPYGLIKYGDVVVPHSDGTSHSYHWDYVILKKAQKLHTKKTGYSKMEALAHTLSIRNKLFVRDIVGG